MAKELLSELSASSLSFSSQQRMVRIDDSPDEQQQIYLTLEGTPAGFRWLASHLEEMARSVEANGRGCGNIVAPWDFKNHPIKMEGWDSLDFHCRE